MFCEAAGSIVASWKVFRDPKIHIGIGTDLVQHQRDDHEIPEGAPRAIDTVPISDPGGNCVTALALTSVFEASDLVQGFDLLFDRIGNHVLCQQLADGARVSPFRDTRLMKVSSLCRYVCL